MRGARSIRFADARLLRLAPRRQPAISEADHRSDETSLRVVPSRHARVSVDTKRLAKQGADVGFSLADLEHSPVSDVLPASGSGRSRMRREVRSWSRWASTFDPLQQVESTFDVGQPIAKLDDWALVVHRMARILQKASIAARRCHCIEGARWLIDPFRRSQSPNARPRLAKSAATAAPCSRAP
jgi:hypothetical protein